jgi:hypothetical protein
MCRTRASRADQAVARAHEVVGLYGDPDTSWGIALDLGVADVDPHEAADRLAQMCADHPHLGAAPAVAIAASTEWAPRRALLASAAYESDSLLRVLVRQDGHRLAIGAHHGAVDGLGLVAVAAAALGQPLRTLARGIGERQARSGFVRSSLRRLGEALVDPPPRFGGRGEPGPSEAPTEDLSELTRPLVARGTAHLAAATAQAFGDRGTQGSPLVVVGASRRADAVPAPDRQTAYVRLRVPAGATPAQVRQALVATAPEPDFPTTSARGLGPWVTRVMRRRLGATAVLSNLGRIEGPVESVAMFPACSGPRAVAIGLASTASSTTLSLRTRRSEFSRAEHAELLADLAARYFDA